MSEDVIYLVTSGAYSDYSVDAAFTSRDKADAWVATHSKAHRDSVGEMGVGSGSYGYYEVEETPLDPVDEELDAFAASLNHHPRFRFNVYPLIVDGGAPDLYVSEWGKATGALGAHHAEMLIDAFEDLPAPVPTRTALDIDVKTWRLTPAPHPVVLTFTGPDRETIHRYARDIFARHRAEVDTAGTSWLIGRINQAAEEANAPK